MRTVSDEVVGSLDEIRHAIERVREYVTSTAVVYISPGMTVQLDTGLHVYGFVQVPLYSDLVGYQLFPRWTANAGISYAF